MADNIGLGEALSNTTRSTGDWGSPLTRGAQMAEARDMKKLQLEQTKAYRDQQAAERMAKHLTAKDGKFHNSKYQKQFGAFYEQALPKMMQAEQSGDVLTYSQMQNEITNELGRLKMIDTDEHELNRAKLAGSVTAGPAQEIYNQGGYQGLLADNEIHVVPLASIDPESGHFVLNDIKDPMLSKKIDYNVAKRLETMAAKKIVGSVNGVPLYKADPSSKEYKNMKTEVLNEILADPAVLRSEMATDEFRKFYQDYHNRTGMDYAEMKDPSMGLPKITEEYLSKKYDNAVARSNKIKFAPNAAKDKGGYNPSYFIGGKNTGKFTFDQGEDGFILTDSEGTPGIALKFKGVGEKNGKETVVGIYNPEVKHIPGTDNFIIRGREEGQDSYMPKISIIVNKSQLIARYHLNDKGLAGYFGYKPAKQKGAAAATTGTPAPGKTVSLATLRSKVGTKGYEGYSEKELIDYYKSQGYTIN